MDDSEIELNSKMLKTIGDSIRLKILKALSNGPRIPADISKSLNKTTPTILEHLEKLSDVGLVEKEEKEGRKYVFYSLTKKGSDLILNKSRVFVFL